MQVKSEAARAGKADPTEDEGDEGDVEMEPAAKKSKPKLIYGTYRMYITSTDLTDVAGVVADKWNRTKRTNPDVSALIAQTSEEQDFAKREEIYSKYRQELTTAFK